MKSEMKRWRVSKTASSQKSTFFVSVNMKLHHWGLPCWKQWNLLWQQCHCWHCKYHSCHCKLSQKGQFSVKAMRFTMKITTFTTTREQNSFAISQTAYFYGNYNIFTLALIVIPTLISFRLIWSAPFITFELICSWPNFFPSFSTKKYKIQRYNLPLKWNSKILEIFITISLMIRFNLICLMKEMWHSRSSHSRSRKLVSAADFTRSSKQGRHWSCKYTVPQFENSN